ncbi:MAG: sucrase ferredoxin [Acidimicrobiales bacterium]
MSALDADPAAPSRDPDLRCAPWTQAQGVDPIGSAGAFDQLLLVEWPLPWPADVSEIPALAEAAADPRARLMTVVPRADDAEADGLLRVVHRRRTSTHHLRGVDHRLPAADVPELLRALLDDPTRDQLDWPTVVGEAPAEVLVCGHGRRDACCGRWGTLLHVELAARTDVRVWRCSHTGGHRFAPTAITLPDGRAWAYVDAALVEGVLARTADLQALAPHDRGCLALDPWAQVAERGVFTELGWQWLGADITSARTDVDSDGRSAAVHLTWVAGDGTAGTAEADVEVVRVLPILVCGEPPEAAVKSSAEYALRRLVITR